MAVRRGGDQLVVCNVDSYKYPEKTFSVDPAQVPALLWRLGQLPPFVLPLLVLLSGLPRFQAP